jgi:hypothetical protein
LAANLRAFLVFALAETASIRSLVQNVRENLSGAISWFIFLLQSSEQ